MGREGEASNRDVDWVPALVRVQVRSPSGAVKDLRTVRLVHGSQQ